MRQMRIAGVLAAVLWAALGATGQGNDPEATAGRIQDAIQAGDLAAASRSLSRALARYPQAGGLYNLRGIVHAKQGELGEARTDFEQAVRLAPELVPGWQNLGRACQALTGETSCAVRAWQHVLGVRPADTEARLALATIYEWQGKFAESLSELQKLQAAEAGQAAALAVRCADLGGLGRVEEAKQAARRLAGAPDFTEADAAATFPVLGSKQGAAAMVALGEALDAKGRSWQGSLERLAVAYEQSGRLADARKTLERVAVGEPNQARHLMELGRVAYLMQDREGALGYLAHARDLTPNDGQVHFLFGMIAMEMDLPLEARRSLERALALDPGNVRYNYAMGSVTLSAGDPAHALPYFQAYVAAKPEDPRGRFALAVAHFAAGEYGPARADMEAIRGRPETAAGAEYFLGRLDRIEDKLEEAAGHLERSIALLASFAESHAELARVRLSQGRIEDTRAELDRALALDRDCFQANATLLSLYQQTRDGRLKAQAERLRELDAQRYARKELMLRTIEVKPY